MRCSPISPAPSRSSDFERFLRKGEFVRYDGTGHELRASVLARTPRRSLQLPGIRCVVVHLGLQIDLEVQRSRAGIPIRIMRERQAMLEDAGAGSLIIQLREGDGESAWHARGDLLQLAIQRL